MPTYRAPGVLVVEADFSRLRNQGHTRIIDEIEKILSQAVASGSMRFRRYGVNDRPSLEWGKVLSRHTTYDAVVLLAHGSPSGIDAGPNLPLSWEEVGEALAPLRPRGLLAIACYGGLSGPTQALFSKVPSLRVVMGSPAPVTAPQALIAAIQLLFEVVGAIPSEEWTLIAAVFNALLTGGVMFRRTRDSIESGTPAQLLLQDILGATAWALLQALSIDLHRELCPPSRNARLSDNGP